MAKKIFTFYGRTLEELRKMSLKELAEWMPSRLRRNVKRGFSKDKMKLVKDVEAGKKNLKTHLRDMIILPSMVGRIIKIYNGKEFIPVTIQEEMLGHYLGEFAMTRKTVRHNAPGIGATRSSASLSVK